MDYFQVGHISNSSLGQFKAALIGEPGMTALQETLDFGNLFHKACLEPEKYVEGSNPIVENMRNSLNKNMSYSFMRNHKDVKLEHEHYRRCKVTGVRVKMKIDKQLYREQADLKSTSCRNLQGCIASVVKYGYNRQAAMYMHNGGADYFTFYFVQKFHPYNVFVLRYHKDNPVIKEGFEEYIFLVNKAKSMGLING